MASAESLVVELAYSPSAGGVARFALQLPPGSCIRDAITQSGVLSAHPELTLEAVSVGVWGQLRSLEHLLRDGDRVELYRPLKVDPKEARRLRHRSHRARKAR